MRYIYVRASRANSFLTNPTLKAKGVISVSHVYTHLNAQCGCEIYAV